MQRIQSLDLARGFTVLFIPAIHTVMLYSKPEVHTSWLGYPLQFIAEGPGGQLLMMLMGIVFTFKKNYTFKAVAIKSCLLLIAGYLLNILKFAVLLQMGQLPAGISRDLQLQAGTEGIMQSILLGDILHFASFAIVILYGIYQLKNYAAWSIGLSIIILLLAPFVWDLHSTNAFADYLLQLCSGQPPRIFFPLFPWLVYPLLGLAIGSAINRPYYPIYPVLLKLGIVLLVAGYAAHLIIGDEYNTSFYRTYPWDTMWHIGIVLLTLSFWNWIASKYRLGHFGKILTYYSQHITEIYIIQWVLICWLLPVFGYQELSLASSIVAIGVTVTLTFSISSLFKNIKSN